MLNIFNFNPINIDKYYSIIQYLIEHNQSYKYFLYNYDKNLLSINNNFYEKKLKEMYKDIDYNKYIIKYLKNVSYYIRYDPEHTIITTTLLKLREQFFEYSFKKYLELLFKFVKINNEYIKFRDIESVYFFKRQYMSLYCYFNIIGYPLNRINEYCSHIKNFNNCYNDPIEYSYYIYYPCFYDDREALCTNKGMFTVSVLDLIMQYDTLCKILYIKFKDYIKRKPILLIINNDSFNFIKDNNFTDLNQFIVEYNYYNNANISPYISFKNYKNNYKIDVSRLFENA